MRADTQTSGSARWAEAQRQLLVLRRCCVCVCECANASVHKVSSTCFQVHRRFASRCSAFVSARRNRLRRRLTATFNCVVHDVGKKRRSDFLLDVRPANRFAKLEGEDEVGRAVGGPCESASTGFSRTKRGRSNIEQAKEGHHHIKAMDRGGTGRD